MPSWAMQLRRKWDEEGRQGRDDDASGGERAHELSETYETDEDGCIRMWRGQDRTVLCSSSTQAIAGSTHVCACVRAGGAALSTKLI